MFARFRKSDTASSDCTASSSILEKVDSGQSSEPHDGKEQDEIIKGLFPRWPERGSLENDVLGAEPSSPSGPVTRTKVATIDADLEEEIFVMDAEEVDADADKSIKLQNLAGPGLIAVDSVDVWRHKHKESLRVANLKTKDLATAHAARLRAVYAAGRRLVQQHRPQTLREHVLQVMRAIRQVSWAAGFVDKVKYHALWGTVWALIGKAWACESDDVRVLLVLEKQLNDLLHVFPKKNTAPELLEMRDEISRLLDTAKNAKVAHYEARKGQYEEFVRMLEKELGDITHQLVPDKIDPGKEAAKMQARLEALLGLTEDAMDLHKGADYYDRKKFKGVKKNLAFLLKHMNAKNWAEMDPGKAAKELRKIQQKAGAAFDTIRKAHVSKFDKTQAEIEESRTAAIESCNELHGNLQALFGNVPTGDPMSQCRSKCVLARLAMWDPQGRLVAPEMPELETEQEEEDGGLSQSLRLSRLPRKTRLSLETKPFEAEAQEYEECGWEIVTRKTLKIDMKSVLEELQEELQDEIAENDELNEHDDHEALHDEVDETDDLCSPLMTARTEVEDELVWESSASGSATMIEDDDDFVIEEDEGCSGMKANIDSTQDVPTTAGTGEETRSSLLDLVDPDDDDEAKSEGEPSMQLGTCAWIGQGWMPVGRGDPRWYRWRHQSLIWQSINQPADAWFLHGQERASSAPGSLRTGQGFPRSHNRGGLQGWDGSPILNLDLDNGRRGQKDACDPSGPAMGPKLLRESRSASSPGLLHPSKAKGSHSRLYRQEAPSTPSAFAEKLCSARLIAGKSASRFELSHALAESDQRPAHPSGIALHLRARLDLTLGDDVRRFPSWHVQSEQGTCRQVGHRTDTALHGRHKQVGNACGTIRRKRPLRFNEEPCWYDTISAKLRNQQHILD